MKLYFVKSSILNTYYYVYPLLTAPGRMPLDARVEEKIVGLVVHEGITDTQTMEGHLRDYVRTQLFTRQTAPPSPNKRFFSGA